MDDTDGFGLAALGRSGRFTVEVLSRPDGGWCLAIEAGDWCVTFNLVSEGMIAQLANLLQTHPPPGEFVGLVVGSLGGMPVRMVWDDEFADRLFLRAAGDAGLVEFTLTGVSVQEFAAAVVEAAKDFR